MHGLLMYSSVCTATPTAATPAVQKRLSILTTAARPHSLPPASSRRSCRVLGTVDHGLKERPNLIVSEGHHDARRLGGNSFY
jgi:hypothetical protein